MKLGPGALQAFCLFLHPTQPRLLLLPHYSAVLKGVLEQHNKYRARHGAPPLKWSTTVAATAQSYSKGCVMQHSHNAYGENLAKGHRTFAAAVDDWYSEEASFSYGASINGAGHFTQMVRSG